MPETLGATVRPFTIRVGALAPAPGVNKRLRNPDEPQPYGHSRHAKNQKNFARLE
ncbi:MAG: hypothetical protein HY695_10870 [Deltaproteobacteria bacterium]|nr:hypothetical protein [Deltaproteobacteria bacterium]